MILYDGIIEELQKGGGISVLFTQLLKNTKEYIYLSYSDLSKISNDNHVIQRKSRFMERYRDVPLSSDIPYKSYVFHSTYYRLPKCSDIPIVTTVHDFTYEKYKSGPAKWLHCLQKYRAIKNSNLIICVSNNTAVDLLKYCDVDEEKIRVVYNGVSDVYRPINDRVQTNSVLFVGARGGYKNFDIAVKAVSSTDHLSLSIVGGGELTVREKKMLDTYLPNRYRCLGYLSDADLNLEYNKAYCLLYPSNYEGFGIPVIEAMRAGCPVIAINSSSIPEVAGDAAILVKDARLDLLVDALLHANEFREEYIKRGYIQSQKFSWDTCVEKTRSVYDELLK
ncbi:mannosyltransferase [Vibrio cyclitrophicus]|uniref:glycosyltransferase family 4 protein n=1 Tax=Vibrio cyclitrophicus TaxID=47951 RepID=UPI000C84EB17|nr:glycosyltransferase family 1 protein [Vibrio cyclitrophicus]PMH39151.1 mannosyltransferase [Vibrio cyclitrophicus]